ncbi:HAD family hydrolase [Halorarum salinum]|uniref:HAD family hydrolase n=1 Tax=Halorarum salinum TaxID=2743089 RepID=A0A7D5LA11_9EURY|nr:HAD family hydrolase [Halobaculum salinum]QLG61487.1 HAD family hydrolase [Halobaculum salinum]
MYDAVLFDVDLTLLAHDRTTEEVLARTFEAASVDGFCSADEFETAAERVARSGTESTDEFAYLARIFRVAGDDAGVDPDATALARAYDDALDHAAVSPLPGAEVVHELSDEYALGAVTNGRERTHAVKLSAVGLVDAFDAVVYGSDVDHVKPHPEPLERALSALDAAPERTLKVGDSLRKDVRPANDLGLTSAWIPHEADSRPPNAGDPQPDHRLGSLAELPDLL